MTSANAYKKALPFVKWAGGKRQLLVPIKDRLPRTYNKYYEPFVGGGALLFNLQPVSAHINDVNEALINTYLMIKSYPKDLMAALDALDNGLYHDANPKEYYYHARNTFNTFLLNKDTGIGLAAHFIFLNKHCFNGLYRVNAQGAFNVPFNNSKSPSYSAEALLAVSSYLQNVTITQGDFETACSSAQEGDFIFFDSPYAPLNPTSFESYTKEGFTKENHVRLAQLFKKLSNCGCFCMATNHNTQLIQELYAGYTIEEIEVRRSINSNASKRKGIEVIIRNY